MKIALFLNENRQILPFYSSGIVEIYSDETTVWECISEIPFDMTFQKSLADVQLKINLLVSEFEGCTLLVVENIKGMPSALLQERGIGIWKTNGLLSSGLLNHVKAELIKTLKQQGKKVIRPKLVSSEQDAEYAIDLIPLLGEDRSLNSMDILIPFMKETNFRTLEITCSHLPKWFDIAVEAFQLEYSVDESEPDLIHATVSPSIWNEDISFRKYVKIPGMGGCSSGGC